MKRRDLLKAIGSGALVGLTGCADKCSQVTCQAGKDLRKADTEPMKLRPHHILDIVTSYGAGERFEPHPYGHSLHTVAEAILADTSIKTELVIGADAICEGCKYLQPDGSCTDVLGQLEGKPSKQSYNDDLDQRVFDYLNIKPGTVMTIEEYLKKVNKKVPGIEKVCTHPKSDPARRLDNLTKGLVKLGIRAKV